MLRQQSTGQSFSLTPKALVALPAASLADHRQARNAQIAGFLFAGCYLLFSRLRFVGYEAADSYFMPEVSVKLNGAAA